MELVFRLYKVASHPRPTHFGQRPSRRRRILAAMLAASVGISHPAVAAPPIDPDAGSVVTAGTVVTADAAVTSADHATGENAFDQGAIQQVVGKQLTGNGRRVRRGGSSRSSSSSSNSSGSGFLSGLFGVRGGDSDDDSTFVPTPPGELQGDVGDVNWDGIPFHSVERNRRTATASSRSTPGNGLFNQAAAASRSATVSRSVTSRTTTPSGTRTEAARPSTSQSFAVPTPPADIAAAPSAPPSGSVASSRRLAPVTSSRRSSRRSVDTATPSVDNTATSTTTPSSSSAPDYTGVEDLIPRVSRRRIGSDQASAKPATKSVAKQETKPAAETPKTAASKTAASKPAAANPSEDKIAKAETSTAAPTSSRRATTKSVATKTAAPPQAAQNPAPTPKLAANPVAANTTAPAAVAPVTPQQVAPQQVTPQQVAQTVQPSPATPARGDQINLFSGAPLQNIAVNQRSNVPATTNSSANNFPATQPAPQPANPPRSANGGYQHLGFVGTPTPPVAAPPIAAPPIATAPIASPRQPLSPTRQFAQDPFAGRSVNDRIAASTASAAIGSGIASPPRKQFVAQPPAASRAAATLTPPNFAAPTAMVPTLTIPPVAAAAPAQNVAVLRDSMSKRHWNDTTAEPAMSTAADIIGTDRNDGRLATDDAMAAQNDMRRDFEEEIIRENRIEDRPGVTAIRSELPSLRVTTYGPEELMIRQTGEYEIRVENRGSIDAEGVLVRAFIPGWARLQSERTTTGKVKNETVNDANRLVWTIDQLEAGETETLFVRLDAVQSGAYQMNVDWTLMPRQSISQVRIHEPQLNLMIEGPDEIVFGKSESYKVRVLNPGDGIAPNVVFILSPDSTPQTQRIGDIPAGKEAQFDVELTAQDLKNLHIRGLATGDLDLRSEAEKSIRVLAAKLEAVLTGPEAKYQNTDAMYSLDLANIGTATSENVVAKLVLPAGVEYLGGIDGATIDGREVSWKMSALPIGESVHHEFLCRLTATGKQQFGFEARGTAAGQADVSIATSVESIADLVLSINDPAAPAPIGSEVVYEIVIRNRGSRAAKDVRAVAQFSHGIEPVRIVGQTGELMTGQVMFDKIDSIAAGEEVKIRVVAVAETGGHHRFRSEVTSEEVVLVAEEATHYMHHQTERISNRSIQSSSNSTLVR